MELDVKNKIAELETEFKLACKVGYVLSSTVMRVPYGLEIKLPSTVDGQKARLITQYIEKKYGFQATFYVKKHNINVRYVG